MRERHTQVTLLRVTTAVAASLVVGAIAHSPPAHAQAGATSKAPAETGMGDIIVTARKRTETAQKVPATINVVSQEALATTGSASLLQLASVAPGINIVKPGAGNEVGITVRGLGSLAQVPSFESSVSLFADGVYLPRSREFATSMFDVERIEVIRGTQAALLGKNTSLGAINLVTRKPGHEFAADVRSFYEFERGSTQFSGGVDVPLAGNLAVRVSGLYSNDKGWVYNNATRNYEPHRKDGAIRGVLRWEATSNLDITAVVQQGWSKNRGDGVEFTVTDGTPEFLATLAGYPGTIDGKLNRVDATASSAPSFENLSSARYSLTANLALGDYTLTAASGYSRSRESDNQDIDFTPGDYLSRVVDETGKQFTQELRIVSPSDRPFDFILGALYLKGRLNNRTTIIANYPFGPVPGVNLTGTERTNFVQDTEAESVFGQANYKISDRLRVSVGGRFTHERKTVDLGRDVLVPGLVSLVVFPPYAPFALNHSEDNFDYSAGAQYDLGPNAMIFASYGKGTKSGGFAQSVTRLENAAYNKEVAKTAEIGFKLQDAARRWLLNISAFNTNVDGFQQVNFDGFNFVVGNTDLRSRGIEVEAYWRPVDGLRLHVNNTYADAKDRITGYVAPLAPKWSGNAGFDYRTGLTGDADILLSGTVDYRSRRYYLPDPAASPSSAPFTPINLSIAVARHDDSWEFRLIGRNITNELALSSGNPAPFLPAANQVGTSERGRTIALQASAKF